jgi:uncharacterized protein involved in exopolysaccharide biosynthesis
MISTASFKYQFLSATCLVWIIMGMGNVNATSAQSSLVFGQDAVRLSLITVSQKLPQSQSSAKERTPIEKQVVELESIIRKTESKIRDFREKYQVVDLAVEAESSVKTINSMNQEITTAAAELTAEKSRIAKMQKILGANIIGRSLVDLQKSGLPEKLVTDYIKADFQRAALEERINALVYISTAYRDRANRLPQLEQTQGELTRKREVSLTTYKALHTKLNQLRIAELDSQLKDPKALRASLEKQLADVEIKLKASETRIKDFRVKHQVVNLATEAVNSVNTINRLNREITDHSAQLAGTKYRIGKIQTLLGTKTIGKNLLSLQKSAWQKAVVEDYINDDSQKETLMKKIDAAVYVSTAHRDRANRLPQLMQTEQELNRQLEINTATYQILRAKLDQLLIAETESRYKDPRTVRTALTKLLAATEAKVREAELSLGDFREKYQVVDLTAEADRSIKIINDLNQKIIDASSQLASEEYRIDKIRAILRPNQQLAINQLPGVKEAISALQEIDVKLAIQRAKFTDRNPIIIDLKKNKRALMVNLQQAYSRSLTNGSSDSLGLQETMVLEYSKSLNQQELLEQRINAFVETSTDYRDRTNLFPQLEQQQRELSRQLEKSKNLAQALRTKLQAS